MEKMFAEDDIPLSWVVATLTPLDLLEIESDGMHNYTHPFLQIAKKNLDDILHYGGMLKALDQKHFEPAMDV